MYDLLSFGIVPSKTRVTGAFESKYESPNFNDNGRESESVLNFTFGPTGVSLI
ncbi:MAG: hypothetical protein AB1414_13705 [bacterium]